MILMSKYNCIFLNDKRPCVSFSRFHVVYGFEWSAPSILGKNVFMYNLVYICIFFTMEAYYATQLMNGNFKSHIKI